jgi:hypothetical protein
MPTSELNEFIQWRVDNGAEVALYHNKKIGIPAVLAQGIAVKEAMEAAIELHSAILLDMEAE